MTTEKNCASCGARNQGTLATYCYHVAFEKTHPGDGRPIKSYPKKPKWCPGFVDEE